MSDIDYFANSDEDPDEREEKANPMKQLRDTLKARDKELKALKTELEEAKTFRGQVEQEKRIQSLTGGFEKFGLTSKHAELFHKVDPEAEADEAAIRKFAEEYSLPIKESSEEDSVDQPVGSAPFTPASGGSSDETGYITREQLDQMYKVNPQKAIQVLQSGKVKWNNPDV